MQEKRFFQALLFSVTGIVTIAAISFSFRCQPLLHQSPIRIKAVVEVVGVQQPFPRFADQKTFGSRPCPIGSSGLVVVNQPLGGSRRGQ